MCSFHDVILDFPRTKSKFVQNAIQGGRIPKKNKQTGRVVEDPRIHFPTRMVYCIAYEYSKEPTKGFVINNH
jgi:hypothetical protein